MRIKKLQQTLIQKNIDLALIISLDETPNQNMVYFSGFQGLGILAITNKNCFLIVPPMEFEKAQATGLRTYKTEKRKRLLDSLALVLKRYKIQKVGIEETACSVFIYKKLKKAIKAKYTDISKICSEIRMKKEPEEIQKIQKACQISDKVFKSIRQTFHFKTEVELKNFMKKEIQKNSCELAFEPIVASAKGTSQPHYNSSGKIQKGFLMLDFGVKYYGYSSDMTRMLYLGKPSNKEVSDFKLVLNTLRYCENAVSTKKKFSYLYDLALKQLDKKAEFFTHALGHGLGLEIHEPPSLFKEDKNKIQENITFTIEPGIYFPGRYGIRIEDTVVYQKGNLKILTKSPKELIIIK